MRKAAVLIFALLIIIPISYTKAQGKLDMLEFSAGAGLSMPVGDAGDFYNTGLCLGLEGFYPYRDWVHFGGRIAYNRWGVDKGGWALPQADIDGSGSVMEFLPQAKFIINPNTMGTTVFFGQAGFGFYRFAWDVETTVNNNTTSNEDSEFKLGLNLGGGVTVHQSEQWTWEIKPLFHIIFTEGSSTKYFSLLGGFTF